MASAFIDVAHLMSASAEQGLTACFKFRVRDQASCPGIIKLLQPCTQAAVINRDGRFRSWLRRCCRLWRCGHGGCNNRGCCNRCSDDDRLFSAALGLISHTFSGSGCSLGSVSGAGCGAGFRNGGSGYSGGGCRRCYCGRI